MKDEQPSMEELQFAHATGQNTQGDKWWVKWLKI
jgi:hypothetical protein